MNKATTNTDQTSINDNSRIIDVDEIISPKEVIDSYPLDKDTSEFISHSRETIHQIIQKQDKKILVITWPCSIHNPKEAIQIAQELKELQKKNPDLYIIMRTYFEKPRSTIWWKWLLNDPNLDNTCDIKKWLKIGRKLLLDINKIWVPTAVEFLDTITPQYVADLVHWWAIWARTTESQEHRKLVSWLSMPIGFKNGTKWNTDIAIDAILASKKSHKFLWITKQGSIAQITTQWNPDSHLILRWWTDGPNYSKAHVQDAMNSLQTQWINSGIIIDFSHANSLKNHKNQDKVCHDVAKQIIEWNHNIIWVMIESNIQEWAQKHNPWQDDPAKITPWTSITDECVSLETNKKMLEELQTATLIRNKRNS